MRGRIGIGDLLRSAQLARECSHRSRERQRARGRTFAELLDRSPQVGADPEATLRRVLNEEIAQGRIVYHSASRRFELNGHLGKNG